MTFNCTALQLRSTKDFERNLTDFCQIVENSQSDIIVAPEVFLTDFAYDRFDESVRFSRYALEKILKISQKKTICFTANVKESNKFYNQGYIVSNQKIIHTQRKYKLFTIGDEIKYYQAGDPKDIKIIDRDGIKIAMLICFELRFKELWKQVEGADIVVIPAKWGKLRKSHLEILSQALAVMNQCFVVVADSSDADMAKSSAIITPFGERLLDDSQEVLTKACDLDEIKKIRRYLKVYE
jgi:predicted amidohydrolase